MNEVADAARDLIEALKTERDELRVQAKLASAELKERTVAELDKLDAKWAEIKATARQFNNDVDRISSAVEDDLEDVTDHLAENGKALLNEIREGYARIRNTLTK